MAGGVFLFLMLTLPYARQRVDDYWRRCRIPIEGSSYQLRQVLIALGDGGWFGVGLGEGTQKFGPLPAAHTDGVFAILGEEVGFVGRRAGHGALWSAAVARRAHGAARRATALGSCWQSASPAG